MYQTRISSQCDPRVRLDLTHGIKINVSFGILRRVTAIYLPAHDYLSSPSLATFNCSGSQEHAWPYYRQIVPRSRFSPSHFALSSGCTYAGCMTVA